MEQLGTMCGPFFSRYAAINVLGLMIGSMEWHGMRVAIVEVAAEFS